MNNFKNWKKKRKHFKELTGQVPIFTEKEKQLEKAERASKIESMKNK